jgi:iron complex outermembrane receptor protein
MSFKKKILPLALAQVIAGGAFSVMSMAPAMAQEAASAPVQRVEITGTNIRRADAETPSPVQVITAEDLKKSGFTTVSQVLQNITSNGQGTLSQGFSGAFATGAAGISLHGLNTSATLVLIDGHRMAANPLPDDNERFFVDVSNIPFDAVERVEVLKDGASATYGSDAMAGVVNIILKKKFVGTTVNAEGGSSTEGGGATFHASVMHGFGDYDADGYNAYVNLEYRHQDSITINQRLNDGQWARLDQSNIGGQNITPGVNTPLNPIPVANGTVYLTNPQGAGGFGNPANAYFYTNPIAPNASYSGTCTYAMLQPGAAGCPFTSPVADIQPATHNLNILGSVTKKLDGDWKIDFKASMFESAVEDYRGDSASGRLTAFPKSYGGEAVGAPGVIPHVVGPVIPAITVPATYPGNPFGVPARVRGIITDAPLVGTQTNSKAFRLVEDLSGSAFGWDIDSSIGWTKVSLDVQATGNVNPVALNAALNAPNGSPGQFLITGGNNPALLASIFPTTDTTETSDLEFGEFHATRSLMELPGGDLGFSMGASVVHQAIDNEPSSLRSNGTITGSLAYDKGSQSVASAYMEMVAPVLKSLELDASLRYDHFSNAAASTTPKIGFKWTPMQEIGLRGTVAKGFRAPNPAENGQSGAIYSSGTTNDPILCPGGSPTTKGNVISQCAVAPPFLIVGAQNLEPEKSTSETLGLILEPIKGWSSTLDFFQVKIENQIIADPNVNVTQRGAPVTETCSDGAGGTTTCTPAVGEILYNGSSYINANSTQIRGLEFDTRYKFKLGEYGSLNAEFNWTHEMSYLLSADYLGNGFPTTYELAGTHGPATIGGNTGNPKNRMQAIFTWTQGPAQVATTFNWIDSFDLTDPSGSNTGQPVNNCNDGVSTGGTFTPWFPAASSGGTTAPAQYCKVASFLDTDISASYKIDKHWTVHGAIINVFNQAPPVDLNTYGSVLPYNPSMHMNGAIGRFINVGANYVF